MLGALFAALLAQPVAAQQPEVRQWVALGDSFSSGEGTRDFDDGTNTTRYPTEVSRVAPGLFVERPIDGAPYNLCRRSPWAPARLLEPGNHRSIARVAQPYQIDHRACSGAKIADVAEGTETYLNGQPVSAAGAGTAGALNGGEGQGSRFCTVVRTGVPFAPTRSGDPCRDYRYQGPQVAALNANTDLVTISIGGNDIGFGDMIQACVRILAQFNDCRGRFVRDGSDAISNRIQAVKPELVALYEALATRAPNARVLVVGYPQLMRKDGGGDRNCLVGRIGSEEAADRIWIRDRIIELNRAIRDAARTARTQLIASNLNSQVEYVDIENVLAGHELCTDHEFANQARVRPEAGRGYWVNVDENEKRNSFHPNPTGYQRMAARLALYIERPAGSVPTPAPSVEGRIDTALVIDSSGSMNSNDPGRKRVEAGRVYLNAALPGDHAGIVDFDSAARTSDVLPLPSGRSVLDPFLDSIDASGNTSLTAGLDAACRALIASPSSNTTRAAILLTDGQGDFSVADLDCFTANGWPVHTLGFGSADSVLLADIAARTGGEFANIGDVANLSCEFQRIRSDIAGQPSSACTAQTIRPAERLVQRFVVGLRQAAAVFSSSWPGSDVVMTLTSPSGIVYGRDTEAAEVLHEVGPTYEIYTVLDPEPGEWTIELYGADVAAEGEPVVMTPTTVPLPGAPPTAALAVSHTDGTAPLTVTFDGSGSSDADGPIESYDWSFDDGAAGADGQTATHTYTEPGLYIPSLLVRDSSGEAALVDGPSILVTPSASFETAGSQAAEPEIAVVLDGPMGADVTVGYQVASGQAGTLALAAGTTRAFLPAEALDGAVPGPDGSVVIRLVEAEQPPDAPTLPARIGTQATHTVSVDAPPLPPAPAPDAEVRRVAGADRIATAVEVSRAAYADGASTVVLARADLYPDALAGAPLATDHAAPLLLTDPTTLSAPSAAEIARLGATRVLLLGGTAAIDEAVEADLRGRGLQVDRFAGTNRFATAAQIAAALGAVHPAAFVAEGQHGDPERGWPDALAVAPLAAHAGRPILLTTRDTLPPETLAALDTGGTTEVTIVGGTVAVGQDVEAQLTAAGRRTARLAGADRYATAAMIHAAAVAAGMDRAVLWLATGHNFPDALAAGPAVAALGESLMLVHDQDLDASPATADLIDQQRDEIRLVRLLGGEQAISAAVETQIRTAMRLRR